MKTKQKQMVNKTWCQVHYSSQPREKHVGHDFAEANLCQPRFALELKFIQTPGQDLFGVRPDLAHSLNEKYHRQDIFLTKQNSQYFVV